MKKLLGIISISTLLLVAGCATNNDSNESNILETDFPSLHINTLSEDELFIDRDLRVESTLSLTNAPEKFQFENLDATVRGRGNSTWNRGEDKRPLRFRFDEAQSMFGSEYEARDWILLANYFDRSLMRNHGALYFASLLEGLDWTPSSNFVHLYVNNDYMGVYQLTDEREVGTDRINLMFDPTPYLSEYFLELDARAGNGDAIENEDYFIAGLRTYDIRFPEDDDRSKEHTIYARDFINEVSETIRSGNWQNIESIIDISSFIDFYIVHELFKDTDAWWLSVFMQIRGQGEDHKLYMGPVWDFDLSSGNSEHSVADIERYIDIEHSPYSLADYSVYDDYSPYGLFIGLYNYWYYYLLEIPEFRELLTARWNEIRDNQIPQTIEQLNYMAITYQSAFERNFERHPILGIDIWRNPSEVRDIDTFLGQVEYLKNWLERRVDWLDSYLNEW